MSLLPFAQERRFVMPSQKQSGKELQDCGELAFNVKEYLVTMLEPVIPTNISERWTLSLLQEGSLGYFLLVNGYFPNRLFLLRIKTLISKTKIIYKKVSFYTV